MKKSQFIKLVLVAAALNSCSSDNQWEEPQKKVYMRSDSTASYSHVQGGFHGGYLPFIAYGIWRNNQYARAGYFSSGLPQSANIGTNPMKSSIVRGGFGSSVYHASS